MTEKANVSPPLSEARYCTVCNTSLSSPEVAEQHYNGVKHQKALKVLSTVGQSPPGRRPETEKTDGNAEYYFNSATEHGTCFVCDVSLSSIENRDEHLRGKRHMKNLNRWRQERGLNFMDYCPGQSNAANLQQNVAKPTIPLRNFTESENDSVSAHQLTSDSVNNVIVATLPLSRSRTPPSIQQGSASQNKGENFWCDICKCEFSGPAPAAQHYASGKHLQKMQHVSDSATENDAAANKPHPSEENKAWCDVCKVPFTGPLPAAQHYASINHQQKVQYQSKIEDEPDSGSISTVSLSLTPGQLLSCQPKHDGQGSLQETERVCNPSRSKDFWCSVCKVPLSGPKPASQHYASIKHLQKEECEIATRTLTDLAQTSTNIGISSSAKFDGTVKSKDTWCEVCKVPLSGPLPAAQHYSSPKHKMKLQFCSEAEIGATCVAEAAQGYGSTVANPSNSIVSEKGILTLTEQNSPFTLQENDPLVGLEVTKEIPTHSFPTNKSRQSLTLPVGSTVERECSDVKFEMSNKWCGLCKVPLTGPEPAKQHYESAKHIIRFRAVCDGDANPLVSTGGLTKQEVGGRPDLFREDKTQRNLSFRSFDVSFVEKSETQSQGDVSTPTQLIDECSLKMNSLHISEDVPESLQAKVDHKGHQKLVGIAACFKQEPLDDSGIGNDSHLFDESEEPDLR